jgi:hypothetical protein
MVQLYYDLTTFSIPGEEKAPFGHVFNAFGEKNTRALLDSIAGA